eukprot:CAMPEP_0201573018 /NCGR_PEP_ID=MMETSP0190_2-20130828/16651_1 /ASSEMBLY_ACC=CAM_ASM_000263 /TAXON_ID=37353 /ORGANISM="Rosalina sp." /LENGTH=142 /DNA_ID=CAMNT_0047999485 /DNA_START=57 /DNA_END=482 /DNA_ORIENTATION=+
MYNEKNIDSARAEGKDVYELAVIGVFFEIRWTRHPWTWTFDYWQFREISREYNSAYDNPAIEKILNGADEILKKEKEKCTDQMKDLEFPCLIDWDKPIFDKKYEHEHKEAIKDKHEHIVKTHVKEIDLREILSTDILNGGYW